MTETIRWASGRSALGGFIAATSDRGLVAVEFGDRPAGLVEALRARFPGAEIVEDEAGLSDLVGRLATVVDHPEHASVLALDARGTEYERRVWDLLREVPAGQTTTYGAIAAKMGTPHDARDVTQAIAANAIAESGRANV